MKRSIPVLVAVAFTLLSCVAVPAPKEPQYVGVAKCKTCHKKELLGNQYKEWKRGYHGKSFETLKSDKALEFARARDISGPPHEADYCLGCHVTAYGEDLARFREGKALPVEAGIQCESCHGPGSLYKDKKSMLDHDRARAAGLWDPGKDEKVCAACHNDTSPSWDPAVGFDYETAREEVAHPIPADVKGKYAEIEKKQKAERKARGEAVEEDEDEEEEEDED
jgi:hypothetical protein